MKVIGPDDVHRGLDFRGLIEALRVAFASPATAPRRSVHRLSDRRVSPGRSSDRSASPDGGHSPDVFALLPAWNEALIGVKAFTYLPGNAAHGRPILHSQILLFDRRSGVPLALIDGTSVTYWRTAAMAALAADYLARRDVKRLLFCGTGNLAPYMILAHATVRSYERIEVWGRNAQHVERTIHAVRTSRSDLNAVPANDLQRAACEADVISCATGARLPLILGAWVRPGTHTDFFGNHERDARECDSELVARARVCVDSRDNVLNEAGEILIPMAEGRIGEDHVVGELADLCAGRIAGRAGSRAASRGRDTRAGDDEITLFKSVGTALADLAAASLVIQRVARANDDP